MYALFEKIDDKSTPNKKRVTVTRFQIPSDTSPSRTSIHRPSPNTDEMKKSNYTIEYSYNDNETKVVGEHILFIYFDHQSSSNHDFIGPLRAINDYIQIYIDSVACLNFLKYSSETIFFISSTNDKQLIKDVHDCDSVEAIFILNSNLKIDKNRFPKLFGVYVHPEELLKSIRFAHEWFEQTQMNFFSFEYEKIFLWSQLWKEEFIKSTNSNVSSDKEKLVKLAEKYYKGNTKLLDSIDNFDCGYDRNDALQWCFSSPFPSRFLHHALSTRNTKYIDLCRFLIIDVSHVLKKSNELKSNNQIFKGIKMTDELLEKLINHTGKLICPKGFFTCTTSRVAALELARSPDYRPDLKPVLFKVYYDSSVPIGELPGKDMSTLVIFDVYTAFRVKWVSCGPVTIVDLEPADEDGRNLAQEYKKKFKSPNIQDLLDKLLVVPKPPPRLPPIKRASTPPTNHASKISPKKVSPREPDKDEIQAEKMVQRGQVDQAIILYKNTKNQSPRVLNNIAQLYAEKKGDYELAARFHNQALRIQEEKGEDITDTLTQIAIAHHNRQDYGKALHYHAQALKSRKNTNETNPVSIANNLIGMANAHWGQENLPEALSRAQEALKLNESIEHGNDLNLALNLAVLANIYHKGGYDAKALEFARRAMAILERYDRPDSLALASVLNNLATIQVALRSIPDAQTNLNRALKICKTILPEGHPKRVTMENNFKRLNAIIKATKNANNNRPKKS
ncbi:unnamed protein product [Rotaria sp. Silwood1]|nr:unnamed protein product [Rotaria sp. Silwood1]CAF1182773.1 unnamed protein product [Rotaria sp. Silwood1]CAF3463537.1 unnamed protein product [Rotaria sp. Silwood1]CAF4710920.1 unnamed protein product [Rotaria sp. Silwood1]